LDQLATHRSLGGQTKGHHRSVPRSARAAAHSCGPREPVQGGRGHCSGSGTGYRHLHPDRPWRMGLAVACWSGRGTSEAQGRWTDAADANRPPAASRAQATAASIDDPPYTPCPPPSPGPPRPLFSRSRSDLAPVRLRPAGRPSSPVRLRPAGRPSSDVPRSSSDVPRSSRTRPPGGASRWARLEMGTPVERGQWAARSDPHTLPPAAPHARPVLSPPHHPPPCCQPSTSCAPCAATTPTRTLLHRRALLAQLSTGSPLDLHSISTGGGGGRELSPHREPISPISPISTGRSPISPISTGSRSRRPPRRGARRPAP